MSFNILAPTATQFPNGSRTFCSAHPPSSIHKAQSHGFKTGSAARQEVSGKAGRCCTSTCHPILLSRANTAKTWTVIRRGCSHIRASVLFCAGSAYGIHLLLVFLLRLRRTSFAWREDFLLTAKQQLASLQTSDRRDLILTQIF